MFLRKLTFENLIKVLFSSTENLSVSNNTILIINPNHYIINGYYRTRYNAIQINTSTFQDGNYDVYVVANENSLKYEVQIVPETQTPNAENYLLIGKFKKVYGKIISIQNSILDIQNQISNTIPVGTILPYSAPIPPVGWLECNGAELLEEDYPELFNVIGRTFGGNPSNRTFKVPDLRGEFIRGWDNRRNVDIGRQFGSWQDYATALPKSNFVTNSVSHRHDVAYENRAEPGSRTGSVGWDNGPNWRSSATSTDIHYHTINSGGDNETRPRNIALTYIIKY